jgi:hypothetical protein
MLEKYFALKDSEYSSAEVKKYTNDYLNNISNSIVGKSKNQKSTMIKGILPVIALYKGLQKAGYSAIESYEIIEKHIMTDWGKALNNRFKNMEKLPLFFNLFGLLVYASINKNDNWSISKIASTKIEIKFDVFSCIYVETCKENNCIELCKLFCDLDTATYASMRKLSFVRTQMLSSGSEYCDFYFIKK